MTDTPSVDGVQSPKKVAPKAAVPSADSAVVTRDKRFLITGVSVAYFFYVCWCLILVMLLPAQSGGLQQLLLVGLATSALGGLVFVLSGAWALFHIAKAKTPSRNKTIALIKVAVVTIPGILLSIGVPLLITREPAISIQITKPDPTQELVAPVLMTFSMEQAARVLGQRGFHAIRYKWDLNGDKKSDEETVEPILTANFDREGIYAVSVTMVASDNSTRSASRRFIIQQAVFTLTPTTPIVDKPVVFSMANLFPEKNAVASVSWDFDGDGTEDASTTGVEGSFTYLRTGEYTVTATVSLTNQTQRSYSKTISVEEPAPLPFPVTVETEPATLIGSPPFPALFRVITDEPLYGVDWSFGDGQTSEGTRVTHTFSRKGTFPVQAKVRSESGVIATVTTLVKVVDVLSLSDLKFEGTPNISGNKIKGEVPLSINIRPTTQTPFVQFSWEVPDATEVGSTTDTLQAIYRRPGNYTITLIAQDLEDHVLRQPISVEVLQPSSLVSIRMEPESGVAPLSVRFDASESFIPGEDITGFIWTFGDRSDQEFGGAITEHTYTNPGTYTVNVTARTSSGEEKRASKTVVVREPDVQAKIFPSRLSGTSPLSVEFDGSASLGSIATYRWNFGDGSQNDGARVTHTFAQPGSYTVQLTVTNANGVNSSATVTISVQ